MGNNKTMYDRHYVNKGWIDDTDDKKNCKAFPHFSGKNVDLDYICM